MNTNDTDLLNALFDRIDGGPTPYMTASSTANTALPPHTSAKQLIAQVANVMANLSPEPFGEWMREKGFDPKDSMLVLPESMRATADLEGPFVLPSYVKFSPMVSSPTLIRSGVNY